MAASPFGLDQVFPQPHVESLTPPTKVAITLREMEADLTLESRTLPTKLAISLGEMEADSTNVTLVSGVARFHLAERDGYSSKSGIGVPSFF